MNAYRLFLWGSKVAPLVPDWLGNALSDLIGLAIYFAIPTKRRSVLSNLAHVLSDRSPAERKRVARGVFRYNIRNYYDLLRAYKIPPAKLAQQVKLHGLEETFELSAKNGNKGVIVYAGHIGSFSLVSQVATANNLDFYLLVEPVKPPELFELVRKLREVDPRTKNISVSSLEIRQIFRALKQPRTLVCFAIDRDVTDSGSPLNFCDAQAILPTGGAEIALRTGALLVPIHVYKEGHYYHGRLYHERAFVAQSTGDKEADVKRVSEQMLAEVANHIRTTPEQWVVLQPIWND
ncbi:MAG TPA: hypothetical protein VH186_32030 [Chloroflexia bacterium]|nr:hypothetical protein [Chloroflexia bacterium]